VHSCLEKRAADRCLSTLVVTPDGRGYGYSWHRAVSDLYLVEGWA
jgi:hypothetical protein